MPTNDSAAWNGSRGRLLVIDDDAALVSMVTAQLAHHGYDAQGCSDVNDVYAVFDRVAPEGVILDLVMPRISGLEVLAELRRRDASATVILFSGDIDVPTTVRALRAGAEDVQTKPLHIDHLVAAIDRGLARTRLMRTNRVSTALVSDPYGLLDDSPAMQRVQRMVDQLARSTQPVLVIGEAGTGKRAVAEMLHQLSPRATRPFVSVSCAGHTADELERALLSSLSNGITHHGVLEMAAGGTLLLDDVGELADSTQQLLLAVLGDHADSRWPVPVDVRVIAATSRDLAEDVRRGALRAALHQRLALLPLVVPPLRHRGTEAIRTLAARFVHAHRSMHGEGPLLISDEAVRVLSGLEWPGNVRQLQSVLEEAFARALDADAIEPMHLREVLERRGLGGSGSMAAPDDMSLQAMERRHMAQVLAATSGNRSEAARVLGITRSTLYKKMNDYGLERTGLQ